MLCSPLLLQALIHGGFLVQAPILFTWRGVRYRINEGFRSDLASVPWWGRWFMGHAGRHQVGAVLHDAAHVASRKAKILDLWDVRQAKWVPAQLSRLDADRLFYDFMQLGLTTWHQRTVAYLAVRAFGWLVWGEPKLTRAGRLLKRLAGL